MQQTKKTQPQWYQKRQIDIHTLPKINKIAKSLV